VGCEGKGGRKTEGLTGKSETGEPKGLIFFTEKKEQNKARTGRKRKQQEKRERDRETERQRVSD
jgi:hypothetical protein